MADENEISAATAKLSVNCTKTSDITLVCEGKTFTIKYELAEKHKNLIRQLKALPHGDDGSVELIGFNSDAMDCLVQFLETDNYSVDDIKHDQPNASVPTEEDVESLSIPIASQDKIPWSLSYILETHVQVFFLASHYDFDTLMACSTEKFEQLLKNERWGINDLLPSMGLIYAHNSSSRLKDIILELTIDRADTLVQSPTFREDAKEGRYTDLLMDLTNDLAKRVKFLCPTERVKKDEQITQELQTAAQNLIKAQVRHVQDMKQMRSLFDSLDFCKGCHASIDVSLEREGSHGQGDWFVRCRKCRTPQS